MFFKKENISLILFVLPYADLICFAFFGISDQKGYCHWLCLCICLASLFIENAKAVLILHEFCHFVAQI